MNKLSGMYFWIFAILFTSFITLTYGFGIYLFPALAPEMINDLNFNYAQMGITTGAVQVGFLIFALASGFLTNLLGAFRIIKASIILCALSLFGLIWADDFFTVSIFLILMGGCAASVWVPMVEVSQKYISAGYQGRVLGLMSSGTGYGVFINSFLIAYLLEDYGWRSVWLSTFCIVLLIGVSAFFLLKNLEKQDYGIGNSPDRINQLTRNNLWKKIKTLPFGQTITILFMMFLNGLSCIPFQTYLSSFLVDQQGASVDESAIAWRVIGGVGMVGGFIMGWVADRITVKWALVIVYVFLSVSTAILLYSKGSIVNLYTLSILFGLAFYSIFGLVPAYISHVYKDGTAALVFSFGNVFLGLGGIIGNALGGQLREKYGSFEGIYALILAASLCTVIISICMRSEQYVSHKSNK